MHNEMDKSRFLALLHIEYEFLMRTLSLYSYEEMLVPDVQGIWSVKDTLAHLSVWLKRTIGWIEIAQKGGKPAIPEAGYAMSREAFDTLNEMSYQANKDRSLVDVFFEFNTTHWYLVKLIEGLSEADLFESDFNGAFLEPPWRLVAGNTFKHYYEHTIPLREWILNSATPQGH